MHSKLQFGWSFALDGGDCSNELLSVLLQNETNQTAVRILAAMNKLNCVICSGIWMDVTVRTVECATAKWNESNCSSDFGWM